jgi:hypothetical protein
MHIQNILDEVTELEIQQAQSNTIAVLSDADRDDGVGAIILRRIENY